MMFLRWTISAALLTTLARGMDGVPPHLAALPALWAQQDDPESGPYFGRSSFRQQLEAKRGQLSNLQLQRKPIDASRLEESRLRAINRVTMRAKIKYRGLLQAMKRRLNSNEDERKAAKKLLPPLFGGFEQFIQQQLDWLSDVNERAPSSTPGRDTLKSLLFKMAALSDDEINYVSRIFVVKDGSGVDWFTASALKTAWRHFGHKLAAFLLPLQSVERPRHVLALMKMKLSVIRKMKNSQPDSREWDSNNVMKRMQAKLRYEARRLEQQQNKIKRQNILELTEDEADVLEQQFRLVQ